MARHFRPPYTYTLHVYDISTGLTRRRSAADLGATPSFHRLLSRPVTLADSWGPLGPLGDPLGTLWGALGKPLGTLGNPRGFLGDPLGTTWRPQEMSWGPLGTPWRSLGDHLPGFLVTLGASWGSFGGILDLQGAPIASPRGSRRPLGGLLGSFWRLRKCL